MKKGKAKFWKDLLSVFPLSHFQSLWSYWLQIRYKSVFKNILVCCLFRLLALTVKLKDTILSLFTDLYWDRHHELQSFSYKTWSGIVVKPAQILETYRHWALVHPPVSSGKHKVFTLWKRKNSIDDIPCSLSPSKPQVSILFCFVSFDPHNKFYF